MSKIVVSGCSYSTGYQYHLRETYKFDVETLAIPGQSNDSITRKIYDYIVNENCKDVLFICQLTWLHRIGFYHDVANKWLDYQPNFINLIPKYFEVSDKLEIKYHKESIKLNDVIDINKNDYKELENMYKTYLKLVHNEKESFNNLLYKIDTLESFVEKTGNKIIFMYWPLIEDETQIKALSNRNFFNIDGEYSILNWSTKNKKNIPIDSHLSYHGVVVFSEILYKYMTNEN
jgi:hypothetical protein